jgi:hypothetical protein
LPDPQRWFHDDEVEPRSKGLRQPAWQRDDQVRPDHDCRRRKEEEHSDRNAATPARGRQRLVDDASEAHEPTGLKEAHE